MQWALAHLDSDLAVDRLVERALMSGRNFTRRFVDEVGVTPARWVLAQRLGETRRLLETTRWSVERIARAYGFGSAVTLRQNVTSAYATTPTSYRQRRLRRPPARPAPCPPPGSCATDVGPATASRP
jgi:transcriptional regulator GlxA family with amidase domain